MKLFFVSLVMIAFMSCSKEDSSCTEIKYNQTFIAEVGQKYCLDSDNEFIINEVQNALCPCNADCIWEGEFILKMKVLAGGKSYDYEFGTSPTTPDDPKFDTCKIKFISITPDSCDANIQKDYRVTLEVVKK